MSKFALASTLASFAVLLVPAAVSADSSCVQTVNGQQLSGVLVNGVCSVLLPSGAFCTDSPSCQSGYCQPDATGNGTCAPKPAAGATGAAPTSQTAGGTGTAAPSVTNPALQNTNTNTNTVTLVNPLGTNGTLMGFLDAILSIVIEIGTIVIIFMLVVVGYKFVAAQGEPGAISEARRALMWTVIGALILLGAKAISIGLQATATALTGQ